MINQNEFDRELAIKDAQIIGYSLSIVYVTPEEFDEIKVFDGFKILDNGKYWYKGHLVIIKG